VASSYGTDRISARRDLGYNPGLIRITPCPPPPSAGEHFQPPDRLSDSIMVSVHSKPNGPNSNRRLADQVIIRKVGAKQRLPWKGELRTNQHTRLSDPFVRLLSGGQEVASGFSGTFAGDQAEVFGTTLVGNRSLSFRATLKRLAERAALIRERGLPRCQRQTIRFD
jgi:hypothetical protein